MKIKKLEKRIKKLEDQNLKYFLFIMGLGVITFYLLILVLYYNYLIYSNAIIL